MMIQMITRSCSTIRRKLLSDQRGNVLMFYGFAVIPLMFSVGMGVDYARAMKAQTKLNAAADAAALNSVSQTMMLQSTTAACNAARALFESQSSAIDSVAIDSVTYSIKKANGTQIGCASITDDAAPVDKRFVTVSYRARSTNMFGGILGWSDLTISGGSGTYASVAPDIDFYIALDTSLSMALPTTSDDISKLQTKTGCTFACHSNKLQVYVQSGTGHINTLIVDSPTMGLNKVNSGTGSVTLTTNVCQAKDKFNNCTSYAKTYAYTKIDASGRYVFDNKPFSEVSGVPSTCKVGTLDKCVYNPNPSTQGVYADSYWYALNQGINLRVTDQKSAVQDLMTLATTYSSINRADYRAALYKFDHANHGTQGVTRVSALTSNLAAVSTAAGNADVSILNDLAGNGCPITGTCTTSGGSNNTYLYTSFKSILTALSTSGTYAIPNPGNGTGVTGDTPQAFLFLVTDGMSDEYICNSSNVCTGGRTRSAMQNAQIAQCTALKNRKVKIAILYTEYTYDSILNDEAGQREIARKAIQGDGQKSIAQALTECASPGLMYTVRTDESISNALQALFSKALATARIIE